MAYHPVCGWTAWRFVLPPHFLKSPPINVSNIRDIIRQISIDYSEYLTYTVIRTCVCVYKGVRRMKDQKEKLIKKSIELLDKLSSAQIEYLYHLACKLFGHASD